MKLLLAILLVLPLQAHASKLVDASVKQYFPSFGLGSTQSVAYNGTAASTSQILSPNGGVTELVQILSTSASYVSVSGIAPATASSWYLPANTPTVVEVLSGVTISAIQASGVGTIFVTHLVTYPANN